MTNKEAADWIKYHISISDYDKDDDLLKAFKKAIEYLEREDRKNDRKKSV